MRWRNVLSGWSRPRWSLRGTLRRDAVAGLVLGVESVPDGLATGLLAGVNPLAGLNAYLVGTVVGALTTSSTLMVVQATGAMAVVVADVPAVHHGSDPTRILVTLSILTGVIMVIAGVLRLGTLLRFVSNAVMVGFISAVGVNIVLGQLPNLTGYTADGSSRVVRAVNTLLAPSDLQWRSIAIGLLTIVLIVVLERTPIGALGMVIAVVATSGLVAALGWSDVATLHSLGVDIGALPTPVAPVLRQVPTLVVPALSLALVGLIQGAGISASFLNPDGSASDPSRDFTGQGIANIAAGVMQGMPVGGSVSASAINRAAGARSRWGAVIAGAVMAVAIVVFGNAMGHLAMPALAGLLILIGVRTVKPADLRSVWRTGVVQKVVVVVVFALTMLIRLQFAVLVGVGVSVLLHAVRQSNQVTIRRRVRDDAGHVIETDPPLEVGSSEVVVLQPYGSLFFAAAPLFEAALPAVSTHSNGSVIILRLRGRTDLGSTFIDVLRRYATTLAAVGSKLVLVSVAERVHGQLVATGLERAVGAQNIYEGDQRVGAATQRAYDDAIQWVAQHKDGERDL